MECSMIGYGRTSRFLALALTLALALAAVPAMAATPKETLENRINQVLELLRSDKYRKAEPMKRTDLLLDATEDLFDKREVAQRVLGVHWRSFTQAQRDEFVTLFTEFLKHSYAQKIGAYTYENERVVFTDEVVADSKAIVKTMVVTSDKRIPVDYALLERDGGWVVYDARIEGVSMVQNYRSQFNDILIRNKPEALLDMLRQKNREPRE
jgi:phospholipid transport system substrate-binding protein